MGVQAGFRLKHIFATLRYSPAIPDARNIVAINLRFTQRENTFPLIFTIMQR
nr:MAG TPA: hypothetical protein [Microviridae sp.]